MGKRKTEAEDRQRPPLELAGSRVRAGSQAHVEIPVARLATGAWLPLPVSVVHGKHPGPTIWLSAAVHGDELNGIPIIREVVRRLDPQHVSGSILAVPIVNVFGLINESRYLPDRRDLNRSFPGSSRGPLASQLAHLFMQQIVKRCDLGIDFHTGSQGRTNLPQIRCNADDTELHRLAEVFSPPAIVHAKMRPGSLRSAAAKLGIRTLLYETGENRRFDYEGIRLGINGVLRVMHHLGMMEGEQEPALATPILSRKTMWCRAGRTGMCRMSASLGEFVERHQKIAIVFDTVGRKDVAVRARTSGVIIGHLNHALVNRGEAIAHIAEPSTPHSPSQ